MRNMVGPQGRVPPKQGLGGLGGMGGMGMNNMNGMGGMGALGGMPGMPGMNPMGGDRMAFGGMVGSPTSPYGHPHSQSPLQHQQAFHSHGMQQHPYQQQQHLLQHQQSGMAHMGLHGRTGSLGPVMGGGISKKKAKRPVVPTVKDKNSPKRPRNSYIFFTLMKR